MVYSMYSVRNVYSMYSIRYVYSMYIVVQATLN